MIACKCYHEGQKAAADPNERKDVPPRDYEEKDLLTK